MDADERLTVRLEGASKSFGSQRALTDVDLEIASGDYVAVMGPNGAGKTTLLKMIAGLAIPTRGTVTVAGVDMRRSGPALRRLVGFVAHESMLYPDLSARENLRFHARLFGLDDPDRAVEEIAGLMGADHVLDRQVRTLSRGTKQRVALARAFIHGPTILLLDEPYTGLDESAVLSLERLLASLHTPDHILLVTLHEVARATAGPDRLLIVDGGTIALDRPTDSLPEEAGVRSLLEEVWS